MIDFTKVGGIVRTLWIGAVIDAYSRRVLAIGSLRGEPNGRFAVRLLRRALARHGAPTWLVSDKGDMAEALNHMQNLTQVPGVQNIKPQLLQPRSFKN